MRWVLGCKVSSNFCAEVEEYGAKDKGEFVSQRTRLTTMYGSCFRLGRHPSRSFGLHVGLV